MITKEQISHHFNESILVKQEVILRCTDSIFDAIDVLTKAFSASGKLLICGNGGSAADAQHIAAEFVIRLRHDLERAALPAIALTTDTSILTAGGNDIGFVNVFSRQVEAFGNNGDVLLAISTSGNSENVIRAVATARNKGLKIIGLLGGTGGNLKNKVDLAIVVPSENTQYIQESHITIGHIRCQSGETNLFG